MSHLHDNSYYPLSHLARTAASFCDRVSFCNQAGFVLSALWDYSHAPPVQVSHCVRDQTRGLVPARQAVYPVSCSSSWIFLFCLFGEAREMGSGRMSGMGSLGRGAGGVSCILLVLSWQTSIQPTERLFSACLQVLPRTCSPP